MEVTFQNNLWDILKFNFYLLPRAKTYRILWVIVVIAFGYVGFITAESSELSSPLARIIAFVLPCVTGLIVMALLLMIYLIVAYFLNSKNRSKSCTLATTADGITLETSIARSQMKWAGIQKIIKTGSYIYVFVSDTSAVVIPQRAFAKPWELEQFYNSMTALWNDNKKIA